MEIKRDSFVIYKNWIEAINKLPEEYQLECYKALAFYGINGRIQEDLSPIADAIITALSTNIEKNHERYISSIQNGKKGGAPKGNQNAQKNNSLDEENELNEEEDNITEEENNPKQPKTTQARKKTTQNNPSEEKNNLNVYDNVYVNDNVNDISLFTNNACACVGGFLDNQSVDNTQPYIDKFSDFFACHKNNKFSNAGFEIIQTMIKARKTARVGTLKYNHKTYSDNELISIFEDISSKKFMNIVEQLVFNDNIMNRNYYILGCILN